MRIKPKTGHLSRSCWGAMALAIGLSTGWGHAQEAPPTAGSAPASAPSKPLARCIPKDGLAIYVEYAGTDAFDDAWRKTAMYRMLNETPLGSMLDDVATQLANGFAKRLDRKVTGAELLTLFKHVFHNGFVAGISGVEPSTTTRPPDSLFIIAIKGASRKDIRPLSSRFLVAINGKGKAELSKRPEGRTVVLMTRPTSKDAKVSNDKWAWWADQDDIVIAMDGERSLEGATKVLDGKIPNAVDHPTRVELFKAENGFQPVSIGFLSFQNWPSFPPGSPGRTFADSTKIKGVDRLDYRWGFSGDALMSITRLKAPKPRQGLLALFDQPTFATNSLPPLPEGVESFGVLSMNLGKAFDLVRGLSPQVTQAIDRMQDALKSKAKLQLRKDLLAYLGPKFAFYTQPASASASSKTATEKAATEKSAPAINPMALLVGTRQIPRVAFVSEVSNAEAFGRSLDTLMVYVNQQLRAATTPPAEPEADTPGGGPGGRNNSNDRRKRETTKVAEFKLLPGLERSYMLNVPPTVAPMPAGVRPTIRLSSKEGVKPGVVSVAIAPDVARQALEVKKGEGWAPPPEVATAFEQLPSSLIYLSVNDTRENTSELLSTLPGKLQSSINAAIAQVKARAAATAGATSGGAPTNKPPAGGPGAPPPGAMIPGPNGAGIARPPVGFAPGQRQGSEPGAQGQPGGGNAKPGEEKDKANELEFIEIQVEAEKMPAADSLKEFLFPETFAVSSGDQGIEFISRSPFPNLSWLQLWMSAANSAPLLQQFAPGGQPNAAGLQPGFPGAAVGAPAGPNSNPNSQQGGGPQRRGSGRRED
ncbi:hypothetical protein [Singulisphaera sp. PoT]|uniref:hypothetical protein n=1 Tax=Singulisphaera sp. PoT TaxID=3411797 RepID=UPI003BF5F2BC